MADPTDQELKEEYESRILEHLRRRGDSIVLRHVWRGHLLALVEWSIVSRSVFDELNEYVATADNSEIQLPFIARIEVDAEAAQITSPNADDIAKAMADSIEGHDDSVEINAMWQGYLAALQEWKFLKIQGFDYGLLRRVPEDIGREEVREIALGFPEQA